MLKREDINKMIFRNQIFGNNEKLKVITVEIASNKDIKVLNCNILKNRNIYKNSKVEECDSTGIANFNKITEWESSFVVTINEDFEDNLRKRQSTNQVIFRFRSFIDMYIYAETSTDISLRNLDDKKIVNRVQKSVRKDLIYNFKGGKELELLYATIIVNNNEDVVRVILHEKGYRGDNIYMLYSNDREDYLGEIFFDSVNEKVCSTIVTEEELIDNKNIFSNFEIMKENYIKPGTNEEVVYDQNGEIIKYHNKDIGIMYERGAYEGPNVKEDGDTNILAYTEKICIGTNLIDPTPFLVIHNFSCDRVSYTESNLNGVTIKYRKDGYLITDHYSVFGDRHITRYNIINDTFEHRTEKGYKVKAHLEPENDLLLFDDLDEKYAITFESEDYMEKMFGFEYTNILAGKIHVCPKSGVPALETVAQFTVNNYAHIVDFVFKYTDEYDMEHVFKFCTDVQGGMLSELKFRVDDYQNREYSTLLKASLTNHNGHNHYEDNYQSMIISDNGSMSNYQSDIYDPNVDNIYMRGIFGIPFLYHKVEEKEC